MLVSLILTFSPPLDLWFHHWQIVCTYMSIPYLEEVLWNAGEFVGLQVEEDLEVVSKVNAANDLREDQEDAQHDQKLDLKREEAGAPGK